MVRVVAKSKPSSFGERLKGLRTAKGWTQMELAIKAGLVVPTITNLETGRSQPSYKALVSLARALNISTAELMSFRERSLVESA